MTRGLFWSITASFLLVGCSGMWDAWESHNKLPDPPLWVGTLGIEGAFGQSLAFDGSALLVGSASDSTYGSVVMRVDISMPEKPVPVGLISPPSFSRGFGWSIGLSAGRIVISDYAGVQVYSSSYEHLATLLPDEDQNLSVRWYRLAATDSFVAVGTDPPFMLPIDLNASRPETPVLVFEESAGAWTNTALEPEPGDGRFGQTLAGTNTWLAVGAPFSDCAKSQEKCGAVILFSRSENGWARTQRLGGKVSGMRFGSSIAMTDELLVIGAESGDLSEDRTGAVHLYRREGDFWAWQKTTQGEGFGRNILINEDRRLVAVTGDGVFLLNLRGGLVSDRLAYQPGDDASLGNSLWMNSKYLVAGDGFGYLYFYELDTLLCEPDAGMECASARNYREQLAAARARLEEKSGGW